MLMHVNITHQIVVTTDVKICHHDHLYPTFLSSSVGSCETQQQHRRLLKCPPWCRLGEDDVIITHTYECNTTCIEHTCTQCEAFVKRKRTNSVTCVCVLACVSSSPFLSRGFSYTRLNTQCVSLPKGSLWDQEMV